MLSRRVILLLLSVYLLAMISTASAARKHDVVIGGYKPIKNLSDPYVVGVAKFAVTEHNKQEKDHLDLVKLVKGESQVVAGTNYKLTLKANDSHEYQAVVYDKPWQHYRSLTSFTPLE